VQKLVTQREKWLLPFTVYEWEVNKPTWVNKRLKFDENRRNKGIDVDFRFKQNVFWKKETEEGKSFTNNGN